MCHNSDLRRKNLEFSSSKCHTLDTIVSLTGITIQRCVLALLKYIFYFTVDWLFFDSLQRHLLSLPPFYNLHQFYFGSFLEGTGVDFNFWVFFISILAKPMLRKLFYVLTVTFSVQGGSKKLILKIHLTVKGTGVDFNFWVFFISILVMTMLTKLFCVLTVTFSVQGGCNLTHPNKQKQKTIGFDTLEINLVHVLFSI